MADKRLQDFPIRTEADDDDLLLISSQDDTYRMRVGVLRSYVDAMASWTLDQLELLRQTLSAAILERQNADLDAEQSIAALDGRLTTLNNLLDRRIADVAGEAAQGDDALSSRLGSLQDAVTGLEIRAGGWWVEAQTRDITVDTDSRRRDEALGRSLDAVQTDLEALTESVSSLTASLRESDTAILQESRQTDSGLSSRIDSLHSVLNVLDATLYEMDALHAARENEIYGSLDARLRTLESRVDQLTH